MKELHKEFGEESIPRENLAKYFKKSFTLLKMAYLFRYSNNYSDKDLHISFNYFHKLNNA